jgi:hypothetical protein
MQPKKVEILTLYPGYDGMVKKPYHATVPLKEAEVGRLGKIHLNDRVERI